MNITDFKPKIKTFIEKPLIHRSLVALSIMLLMTLSFGIGKLSVIDKKGLENKEEVAIYLPDGTRYSQKGEIVALGSSNLASTAGLSIKDTQTTQTADTKVFASKNGKNYYYINCTAGNRIKEENKVWFKDPSAAEAAGYTASSQCR